MFFGGSPVFGHNVRFAGGRRGGNFHRRGTGSQAQESQGFNIAAVIQHLPVLFLVFFTLIGNSPSEPIYRYTLLSSLRLGLPWLSNSEAKKKTLCVSVC